MGAHTFVCYVHGETPEQAYKAAVEQALYYCGHDPYNGTISTTNGFIMIPLRDGESIPEWEIRVEEDPRVRKWGNCACVKDPNSSAWCFSGWAAS